MEDLAGSRGFSSLHPRRVLAYPNTRSIKLKWEEGTIHQKKTRMGEAGGKEAELNTATEKRF